MCIVHNSGWTPLCPFRRWQYHRGIRIEAWLTLIMPSFLWWLSFFKFLIFFVIFLCFIWYNSYTSGSKHLFSSGVLWCGCCFCLISSPIFSDQQSSYSSPKQGLSFGLHNTDHDREHNSNSFYEIAMAVELHWTYCNLLIQWVSKQNSEKNFTIFSTSLVIATQRRG